MTLRKHGEVGGWPGFEPSPSSPLSHDATSDATIPVMRMRAMFRGKKNKTRTMVTTIIMVERCESRSR
jgi:hypothetical protein